MIGSEDSIGLKRILLFRGTCEEVRVQEDKFTYGGIFGLIGVIFALCCFPCWCAKKVKRYGFCPCIPPQEAESDEVKADEVKADENAVVLEIMHI